MARSSTMRSRSLSIVLNSSRLLDVAHRRRGGASTSPCETARRRGGLVAGALEVGHVGFEDLVGVRVGVAELAHAARLGGQRPFADVLVLELVGQPAPGVEVLGFRTQPASLSSHSSAPRPTCTQVEKLEQLPGARVGRSVSGASCGVCSAVRPSSTPLPVELRLPRQGRQCQGAPAAGGGLCGRSGLRALELREVAVLGVEAQREVVGVFTRAGVPGIWKIASAT
jgi:hypothetical protein